MFFGPLKFLEPSAGGGDHINVGLDGRDLPLFGGYLPPYGQIRRLEFIVICARLETVVKMAPGDVGWLWEGGLSSPPSQSQPRSHFLVT